MLKLRSGWRFARYHWTGLGVPRAPSGRYLVARHPAERGYGRLLGTLTNLRTRGQLAPSCFHDITFFLSPFCFRVYKASRRALRLFQAHESFGRFGRKPR